MGRRGEGGAEGGWGVGKGTDRQLGRNQSR